MKFVCSFAWADLSVHPAERTFVARLLEMLDLGEEGTAQVERWLQVPPAVDPTAIPTEHRAVFLRAIDGVISADGEVAPEERESFDLLKDLLTGA